MSYCSFHDQASSDHQRAALVAAALGEVAPGGVGDRRAADAEGGQRDHVARALVVVGEALGGGADGRRAGGDLDRLEAGQAAGAARVGRRGGREALQARELQRLQHGLAVLVLVADDELESVAVADAALGDDLERAAAHLIEVLERALAVQELDLAARRPWRLEGVVGGGKVLV